MATEVGVGYVSIVPSAKGFGAKLSRDVDTEMAPATKSASSKFAGMAAAAGGALAAMGLGRFVMRSIQASSDLAESMSKVEVVFGDNAAAIQAWADTSATAFGQSKQQALEAAGTFGNLFTSMKIGGGQSAEMSTKLVELAGDLASFNNIDPTEALDALRSGLVGETEPMRRLGVNMNEATLKAKALELGLGDGVAVLTPAQKAQAAYALILEQTTNAQGDFARTSGGLANKQRIATAQFEDASAALGDTLRPILTEVMTVVSDLLAKFTDLPGPVQAIIIGVLALAAAAAILAPAIMAVGGAIGILTSPIGLIVAAIAALVAGLVWAYNNVDWFRDAVDTAWDVIQEAVREVVLYWKTVLWPTIQAVFEKIVTVIRWYISIWRKIWDTAWSIVETVVGWVTTAWRGFFTVIRKLGDLVASVFDGLPDPIKAVINWIADKIEWIIGKIQGAWDFLMQLIGLQNTTEGDPNGASGGGDSGGTGWASGGFVPTDTKGTVHGGEFVLTRQQVAQVGVGRLESWRKGGQPPGGGGFNVGQVVINNPRPEPASDSLPRSIRKLAYLGGTA